MQRVVTYLYPQDKNASNLKVFQDRTNQIRAFYFTRDYIQDVEQLESGKNYAVYFLFDKSENEQLTKVYVGQSKNGAYRMKSHVSNKMFWSFCLMFVTDNNSFDALTIDYMEYYFVNKLRKSGKYILDNKDMRFNEPNISIYDKPTIAAYISQIEFLLKAEGINIEEDKVDHSTKYYLSRNKSYRNDAKLFVKDGNFILAEGSLITRPKDSTKHWNDGGRFHRRYNNIINELLEDKKIEVQGNRFKALINLTFSSPSAAASLISGISENGWKFFEDIEELRET